MTTGVFRVHCDTMEEAGRANRWRHESAFGAPPNRGADRGARIDAEIGNGLPVPNGFGTRTPWAGTMADLK